MTKNSLEAKSPLPYKCQGKTMQKLTGRGAGGQPEGTVARPNEPCHTRNLLCQITTGDLKNK